MLWIVNRFWSKTITSHLFEGFDKYSMYIKIVVISKRLKWIKLGKKPLSITTCSFFIKRQLSNQQLQIGYKIYLFSEHSIRAQSSVASIDQRCLFIVPHACWTLVDEWNAQNTDFPSHRSFLIGIRKTGTKNDCLFIKNWIIYGVGAHTAHINHRIDRLPSSIHHVRLPVSVSAFCNLNKNSYARLCCVAFFITTFDWTCLQWLLRAREWQKKKSCGQPNKNSQSKHECSSVMACVALFEFKRTH